MKFFNAARMIPKGIVSAVLVEFAILNRYHRVDQAARQLVIGDGLPILDVDLAEDLIVPIDDDAGRFHLLELD